MPSDVDAVRAFNRFHTRWVGALRAGLLETEHSLTEARVLFELARAATTPTAELRARLDMDAGHLSRTLTALERRGLVERVAVEGDGRRRDLALTASGRAAAAELDTRSAAHVGAELDRLDAGTRRRLVGAMSSVRSALGDAAGARPVVLRAPRTGELGWIVTANAEVYAEQFGWDASYEALCARIVADYAASEHHAREAVWIAEVDGAAAGCVMCLREDDDTARLRLLLVTPAARGLGVGSRLVDACVAFAREQGYARLVLWTNDPLTDARRIYERAGFTMTSSAPHTSFGHELVGSEWELPLT